MQETRRFAEDGGETEGEENVVAGKRSGEREERHGNETLVSVIDSGGKRTIGGAPGGRRRGNGEETGAEARENVRFRAGKGSKSREERGNETERALFSRVVPRGAASRRCCSANPGARGGFCAPAIRCELLS